MLATVFATFFETRGVEVNYYQHGIIFWILIGLIAGWLAGKIARGAGYGCITDILLGLVGSLLGGWIFARLGIFGNGAFIYSLAAATLGAVILVSIVHLIAGDRR